MKLLLGCVADDYTGASDVASAFRNAGLRTIQTIGLPNSDFSLQNIDAVVISLKSRSIAAERAVAQVLDADFWLRKHGVIHVLLKICSTFDSTDCGNIGPVTDALRRRNGGRPVIVNPTFLETNRSVYAGHLFVGEVPLNESPLKDHPLNPMRDSNLVRTLSRQSSAPVGLISFGTVDQGPEAIHLELAKFAEDGFGAVIADAVSVRHLNALGEVALSGPVSTGASGLGAAFARILVRRHGLSTEQICCESETLPQRSRSVILAGSCSVVTRQQVEYAHLKGIAVRFLDVERALGGAADAEVADILTWVEGQGRQPVIITSWAAIDELETTRVRHGREASAAKIEKVFADLAHGLYQNPVTMTHAPIFSFRVT